MEANDRLIHETAVRLQKVHEYAYGPMNARTVESFEGDIRMALEALATYPDCEHTHGLVQLGRFPGSDNLFTVSLAMGNLQQFKEKPDAV